MNPIVEGKTDENGKITFDDLRPGDYLLVEKEPLEGYNAREPLEVTVELDQMENKSVEITNTPTRGSIELIKTDDLDSKLDGAVFKLESAIGKTIKEGLTTENGKIVVNNLKPGTYYFIETKAPFGHDLDSSRVQADVSFNQQEIKTVETVNERTPSGVELTKVDNKTGEFLPGTTFELQDRNGKAIEIKDSEGNKTSQFTTNKEGKITVEGLKPGNYQFVEVEASEGYQLDDGPILFTINLGQTDNVAISTDNQIIKSGLTLTKVDADTGEVLSDVVFELQDAEGNRIATDLTTNNEGMLEVNDLRPGNYQLIETQALDGYDGLSDPIQFTVDLGQKANKQIKVDNLPTRGSVTLVKRDDLGEILPGATFRLQDAKGTIVASDLESDKEGLITVDNLEPRKTYYFVETTAPFGHDLDETPLPVKVDFNQEQEDIPLVEATNERTTSGVELIKVDNETNEVLSGAIFELQDSNGNVVEIKNEAGNKTSQFTTNKDGELTVDGLKPGDYQFVEVEAPNGYHLDETPITFTIELGQAANTKIKAENQIMKSGLTLTKVDADTGDVLSDVMFELQDAEGNRIATNLATNKDGVLEVNDLRPGNYQLIETKTLDGYDVLSNSIEFTIEVGQTDNKEIEISNVPTRGSVMLTKTDELGQPLKGATFNLEDEAGKVIKEGLISDEDGRVIVTDLEPRKTYYFVETKAPFGHNLDATPVEAEVVFNQQDIATVDKVNERTTSGVEVTKLGERGNALQGVMFNIQDKEGKIIREDLITNKEGKIIVDGLKPGNYHFVETETIHGYDLLETKIPFKIQLGQKEFTTVEIVNDLTTGSVRLTKVGEENETLSGAMFNLVDEEGKLIVNDIQTNEEGVIEVNDLKPGTYYFFEIKAPNGYQLDDKPISFTIEKGQKESLELEVQNKKVPESTTENELPNTTTNMFNLLLLGIVLLLMGILAYRIVNHRAKKE